MGLADLRFNIQRCTRIWRLPIGGGFRSFSCFCLGEREREKESDRREWAHAGNCMKGMPLRVGCADFSIWAASRSFWIRTLRYLLSCRARCPSCIHMSLALWILEKKGKQVSFAKAIGSWESGLAARARARWCVCLRETDRDGLESFLIPVDLFAASFSSILTGKRTQPDYLGRSWMLLLFIVWLLVKC